MEAGRRDADQREGSTTNLSPPFWKPPNHRSFRGGLNTPSRHLGPPVCVPFRPRGGGARLRLGPDDCKDPFPPFFSQSWRGHTAAVSEDKGACMFWSPEEASYISHKPRNLVKASQACQNKHHREDHGAHQTG
ncbi:hypothetical protein CHARACLAT_006933 [Characodon lateralis]|uniref:Uncharacterized protein n=1 Tax=Characodon lateralis TaxID=208331 RepID=A0ABU7E887_9TELE|nr:hypothetical protein [Characodon lateralis]